MKGKKNRELLPTQRRVHRKVKIGCVHDHPREGKWSLGGQKKGRTKTIHRVEQRVARAGRKEPQEKNSKGR